MSDVMRLIHNVGCPLKESITVIASQALQRFQESGTFEMRWRRLEVPLSDFIGLQNSGRLLRAHSPGST